MSANDGGSAFPTLETEKYHPQFGMSLRDYFAAQAMNAMAVVTFEAAQAGSANAAEGAAVLAMAAYRTADAMLTERAKIIEFPASDFEGGPK